MKPFTVHLVPKWIFDSFKRHNNLVDIRSYQKLRQAASLVDLAHLEIVRQKLLSKVFAGTATYTYVNPLYEVNTLGETELIEHEASVGYLVSMNSEQESVMHRLEGVEEEEVAEDNVNKPKPYEIIADTKAVFVVVDEGFIRHMGDAVNRIDFLTRVLKSAYGVAPVSEVNGCCFYRLYLDALVARR